MRTDIAVNLDESGYVIVEWVDLAPSIG